MASPACAAAGVGGLAGPEEAGRGGGGGASPQAGGEEAAAGVASGAGGRRRRLSSSSSSSSSASSSPSPSRRGEGEGAAAGEAGGGGGEESPESFSNLPSCGPSSSDLNSDSEEAAAAAAGAAETAAAASPSPPAPKERFPGQSVYHLKWVRWKEENTPVVTQNENGPCPLLAIMNVLLLAWKVRRSLALQGTPGELPEQQLLSRRPPQATAAQERGLCGLMRPPSPAPSPGSASRSE